MCCKYRQLGIGALALMLAATAGAIAPAAAKAKYCDHRHSPAPTLGVAANSFALHSVMSDHSSTGNRALDIPQDRSVFFSFSYDEDRYRADAIYDLWRARNPNRVPGFADSRVSQEAKASGEEDVKRAIRAGVDQSTVTCVLIGAHTWQDRWVRYEIARSVERGNGLFGVRINGIADPKTQQKTPAGWNPLAYVGLGKIKGGSYLLYENINGQWIKYQDHALSLAKPPYLPDMSVGYVQPLSVGLHEYDYVAQNGTENLAEWIEQAAEKAGK